VNILWIEDNQDIDKLRKEFFEDSGLFEESCNQIELTFSFDDAYKKVKSSKEKYDLIVIDINLENFDIGSKGENLFKKFGDIETPNDFLKEAGFHLYLELIKQGFENNRIIFLTGNTDTNNISALQSQFQEAYDAQDKDEIDNILNEVRKILDKGKYDKMTELVNNGEIHEVNKFWLEIAREHEPSDKDKLDTYPKFKKRFELSRLPMPTSINKNDVDQFHNWLEKRLTRKFLHYFEYITLRRGIIEGCNLLIHKIDEGELTEKDIIFNNTTENEITIQQVKDKLEKIKNLLPLNMPKEGNKKENLFAMFLKEISADWEMSKGYFLKEKLVSHFSQRENIEYLFKNFCQDQMKILRNWTAHNQLPLHLTEKDVAFFFMIAMRGLFDLRIDTKFVDEYEKILSSVFDEQSWENEKIKKQLAKSYCDLRKIYSPNQSPSRNEFSNVLREVWKQNNFSKNNSIKYFYQNFWHSLIKVKTDVNLNIEEEPKVEIVIGFDHPKLRKDTFPYLLGSCIYRESF